MTADGVLRRASADEHPDLFWGVRGAGANFGVVVAFEYRLHPVGPLVFGDPLLYTLDKAPDVMRLYREYMEDAADEMTAYAIFLTVPPVAPFPAHLHGKQVLAIDFCFVGPVSEGEAAIASFRTRITPDLDLAGPLPYVVRQSLADASAPYGLDSYHKSTNLTGLTEAVIAELVDAFGRITDPFTTVHVARMGRRSPGSHRMRPRSGTARRPEGVYVYAINDDTPNGAVDAYGVVIYDRLTRVKRKYDPTNVFRNNHNIKPSTPSTPWDDEDAARLALSGSIAAGAVRIRA